MGSGNSMGGMSDVLRIQMEKVELENTLASLLSQRKTAEAAFNTLLNQSLATPISVPDSLERLPLSWSESMALDNVISNNPMLTMLEAEGNAYRAKAEMDKKMSYPMLGIGLQYSLIGKKPEDMSMGSMSGMNGKDMFMPMLKISLPIFRKKYNAQQRESKHYWKSSELKYENTMNQLQAEYIRNYPAIGRCRTENRFVPETIRSIVGHLPTDRPGILDRKYDLDRRDPSGATNVELSLEEKRSDSGI